MNTKQKLERIKALCDVSSRFEDLELPLLKLIQTILKDDFNSFVEVTSDEVALGISRGIIHAIKAYKDRTGRSLIESKKELQTYFQNNKLKFFTGK